MDFNFIDKLSADEIDKLYDDADLLAEKIFSCYCEVSRTSFYTDISYLGYVDMRAIYAVCLAWTTNEGCNRYCSTMYNWSIRCR